MLVVRALEEHVHELGDLVQAWHVVIALKLLNVGGIR